MTAVSKKSSNLKKKEKKRWRAVVVVVGQRGEVWLEWVGTVGKRLMNIS